MRQIYDVVNLKRYASRIMKYVSTTRPEYLSNQNVCDFRMSVLVHAQTHGMASAIDAFSISRSTFYNWRKAFKQGGNKMAALAPLSTRPVHLRTSAPRPWHKAQILALRQKYYGMGKEKIKVLLDELCQDAGQPLLSVSTIGRIITHLKKHCRIDNPCEIRINARTDKLHVNVVSPQRNHARRKNYAPDNPGDLLQMDCITLMRNNIRRYLVSAIDYKGAFAYSYAYKTLSSLSTTDFWGKFTQVVPFGVKHVQTDNGSEFHKHFQAALDQSDIRHFWNYPRTPKSNGKIERYNRTIQEEFAQWHMDILMDDIDEFNRELTEWLIYYNTVRPHHSVRINGKQVPPLKGCLNMLGLSTEKSSMYWTYTGLGEPTKVTTETFWDYEYDAGIGGGTVNYTPINPYDGIAYGCGGGGACKFGNYAPSQASFAADGGGAGGSVYKDYQGQQMYLNGSTGGGGAGGADVNGGNGGIGGGGGGASVNFYNNGSKGGTGGVGIVLIYA